MRYRYIVHASDLDGAKLLIDRGYEVAISMLPDEELEPEPESELKPEPTYAPSFLPDPPKPRIKRDLPALEKMMNWGTIKAALSVLQDGKPHRASELGQEFEIPGQPGTYFAPGSVASAAGKLAAVGGIIRPKAGYWQLANGVSAFESVPPRVRHTRVVLPDGLTSPGVIMAFVKSMSGDVSRRNIVKHCEGMGLKFVTVKRALSSLVSTRKLERMPDGTFRLVQ
jgi:hypothetical protein